ncbi:DEAD/DEAH box helicase [Thermaerobacillus caldiproteolyticus]|uniref:DEAD/DEAH box helicase n=1 Tax=Thermaerobacillus caldiproteolyticus TaxID=247480 RepID=UPI0018F10C9C|nr:DEAD/DEAH box helicase family protein [Anoxybacillus caldiproteolyticus]
MFEFNNNYFMEKSPNILNNEFLREPQIEAYQEVFDHFVTTNQTEHALVILPTGTGKTGLMAILPYGISKGRVLIITPQLVIKDSVLGSLDPEYDKNFWIMAKVLESRDDLPAVIEYEPKHTKDILEYANIIILNVQKLQKRLASSLLNKVPNDFFDMIIIDEAHHAEAQTWKDAIEYFSKAKVVKLTGTPFRSDGQKLSGKKVYEYKLREAMINGYVKSLERIVHIPEKLYLTVDKNDEQKYSIEEIREMGIKDEDWINRSVALSPECNRVIVEKSIELLEEKLSRSQFPHKIIAVACSIWHAEKLKELYEDYGYEVAIVHSKLDKATRQQELDKIEQHKVKVVINVAMLGEGYDHKYFSVAAIFRPFKGLLPYAQFIGRVLRSIEGENVQPEDNIAAVVYHKELGLEKLWKYYKDELKKKEIIRKIKEDPELNPRQNTAPRDTSFGEVYEEGEAAVAVETYIESELIKERERRKKEEEDKIKQMMSLLNISRETAEQIIKQTQQSVDKERLLRPDKYVQRKRKKIDDKIKYEIVPDLLVKHNLNEDGSELKTVIGVLPKKYNWIKNKFDKNSAILAVYLEKRLNDEIGDKRDNWTIEDWSRAEDTLENIVTYLSETLKHYFGGETL